jgi:hypothetical protein
VEQGFRGALPHACGTMSAYKRTCALQGVLRSTHPTILNSLTAFRHNEKRTLENE